MNIQTVIYNGVSFLNVHNPQELEIKHLKTTYGFDPLHLEDYISRIQIPQIEQKKDYSLVVLDFPASNGHIAISSHKAEQKQSSILQSYISFVSSIPSFVPAILVGSHQDIKEKRISTGHINFFIGKDYLVVLHDEKTPLVDEIFSHCQKTLKNRQLFMSEGSVFLFYRIVDVLVDSSFAMLNEISSSIDFIDKQLEVGNSSKVVEAISITRRNIVVFQTMIKQAIPVFTDLEKGKYAEFNNMTPFWSNILDHLQKISERLDDSKELNEGIANSHESLLTVRTNEIVKVLTIFTAIMLPLTLVASIYGMNIKLPFAENPVAFLIIIEIMAIIALGMIFLFKSKRLF